MPISERLAPSSILLPLQSGTREGVIRELIAALPRDRSSVSDGEVFKAVMERELASSTGVGAGVAIPHAKLNIPEELVLSFGVSEPGIDFSAADGEPVRIVFLLVSRRSAAGLHIRALANIARLIRNEKLLKSLLFCKNPSEVLQLISTEEADHPSA